MKQQKQKNYEAPTLTVVTISADRGYASSTTTFGLLSLLYMGSDGSEYIESRNDDNGYTWGAEWN